MSRLTTVNPADASGAVADVFAQIRRALGKVPNVYATVGTHSPEGLSAVLAVDAAVAAGSLPKADVETIKIAVSADNGCGYCLAAHTLVGKMAGLSPEVIARIRAGDATGDVRRDALVRFVRAVHAARGTLPADEVRRFVDAGYTERQVIEVCLAITSITFTNLVNHVNDTVLDFPAAA